MVVGEYSLTKDLSSASKLFKWPAITVAPPQQPLFIYN